MAYLIGGGACGGCSSPVVVRVVIVRVGACHRPLVVGIRACGGCSSLVVVRVVIVMAGARRRPWVVGIRAPLLFMGCGGGGGGGRSPSLVEGGGGGLSSSCPIVGVLCVIHRRRVGRSSSVMSVHGIAVL